VSVRDVPETVKTFTVGKMRFPETVTLRPAPGANTMFDVAEIWIFDETVVIDPNGTRAGVPVNTARMKTPDPPLPAAVDKGPPLPPDPVFEGPLTAGVVFGLPPLP
jgi:hypothetical protein